MKQVALQIRTTNGAAPVDVDLLGFAVDGTTTFLGGRATTDPSGIASTRRANGAAWLPIINAPPTSGVAGTWRLELSGAARALLDQDKIDDILLGVSFVGEQPAWP